MCFRNLCFSGLQKSLSCHSTFLVRWEGVRRGVLHVGPECSFMLSGHAPCGHCSQELCKRYFPLPRLPAPTEHLCPELPVAHLLTTRAIGSCPLYRLRVWAQGKEAPSPPVCIAFSLGTKAEMLVATFWLHRLLHSGFTDHLVGAVLQAVNLPLTLRTRPNSMGVGRDQSVCRSGAILLSSQPTLPYLSPKCFLNSTFSLLQGRKC